MRFLPVLFFLTLCTLPFITIQCANDTTLRSSKPAVEQVRDQYVHSLRTLDSLLDSMATVLRRTDDGRAPETARALFLRARLAYKQAEYLVEYYHPHSARQINGPALDDVEEDDPTRLIPPEGFQVIEELLFAEPDAVDREQVLHLGTRLGALVQRSINRTQNGVITDDHVFDALRLQIARISTLAISGFDSPVAQHSLPEASASLASIRDALGCYLRGTHDDLYRTILRQTEGAQAFLAHNSDFNSFDRLTFLTRFLNPLAESLAQARTALGIGVPDVQRPFRTTAVTLFDTAAFDAWAYAPADARTVNDDMIALGRTLFFDPVLSGNNRRACASCHMPELAFSDGRTRSVAFDFKGEVARNAPTLINVAFQSGQFYDLRTTFLEDQANDVVSNKAEMHGSLHTAARRLATSSEYTALFARAFARSGDSVVSDRNIRLALAAYMRSLSAFNSRFDRYMRGDSTAMTTTERHGFNLFMGKAKCGTCHFMPLFNGTVPPAFTRTELERIGVPKTADTTRAELDDDTGRYAVFGIELDRFAFKTTTVRNAALTAPYMHNGVFGTLEQVLDFYNRGGAQGLGIAMEHQTLPPDRLNLTQQEQQAVIAFLHTLTDTTGLSTRPHRLPTLGSPTADHRTIGGEY